MWREHVDWLARAGYRAIAVDLPGFGEATIEPGRQAPWEDVLQTLHDLNVPEAVLVGDSFGAAVSLRVAAVAPAAVSALLLVSPPPLALDPSPALSAAWEAETKALARGDTEAAVTAVVDAWLVPNAPDALRRRVAAMQRRAFELQSAAGDAEEAPDPLEGRPRALQALRIPVVAVAGEADMPDFKAGAREIADLAPHGRCELIAGAGHLAPLEAPEEFRAILLGLLGDLR
jgi:3-oxoadipate enol-lactonase